MKHSVEPSPYLFPLPAVLVSCGNNEKSNLITISWTGTLSSDPPMCYISVRPERHSRSLLQDHPFFVINLLETKYLKAVDGCGIVSGRNHNKWEHFHLTPEKSLKVTVPSVQEALLNIECEIASINPMGSHDVMMARVLAVRADERLLDEKGRPDLSSAGWIVYNKGFYHSLGPIIGKYGQAGK